MQHGQNQRWDNNTLTLHNNLGNLLPSTVSSTEILEARLSNKPASGGHTHPVPHSSTSLHQHLSTCLSTSSATSHNFGHWRNQGLFAPWDRVKISSSSLWKNLVKLIPYYSAQCYKSWGTVSLIRYLQNEQSKHSSRWPPKISQIYRNTSE